MKKVLLLTLCLLQSVLLFGATRTAKFQSEEYNIHLTYNDTMIPGDAVFVRMTVTTPKSLKMPKEDLEKLATIQILLDKKVVMESPFYPIAKTNKLNSVELLGSVPVSMWWKNGNYTLKIIVSPYKDKVDAFELPTTFKTREFVEEVIKLNPTNTAIKTNNSPKRSTQINKLNDILGTTSPDDIFSLTPFIKPTNCERITGTFGDRRRYDYSNGNSSYGNPHNGIDYGVPEGTEVRSCAAGKVVMAEERISTGWSIVVEHLPGLYSLYYHLSSMSVKEGDMVEAGDLLGLSGKTGLATGPHLHWEVRLNGHAVNPEFFLNDFAFEGK